MVFDHQHGKSSRYLSLSEREEVSRCIVTDESIREIANRLSRSPSTISREINRNGGCHHYRASRADKAAWERAKRPKLCKLVCNQSLSMIVARKLKTGCSPQQISGWLKRTYSAGENFYVSHETIYKALYIQARGALIKELIQCLRTRHTKRRSKQPGNSKKPQGHFAKELWGFTPQAYSSVGAWLSLSLAILTGQQPAGCH